MPMEPFEAVALLRERHIHDLSLPQLEILSGIEMGCETWEMAAYLRRPEGRLRQEIAELEHLILDPLGLEIDRPHVVTFTRGHFRCCTARCIDLVNEAPEGREQLALLRKLHVPGLTRRELQVAGAREKGCSYLEIAEGLGIQPASANRLIGRVQRKPFEGSGINPTPGKFSKWTYEQYDCCTRGAAILFEKGELFDR